MRELLEAWGIEFDSTNVVENPAALDDAAGEDASLAPTVIAGERVVRGWNPRACAAMLGVDYRPAPAIPASDLGAILDRVLAVTERMIADVPDAHMERRAPHGDRSLRDLAYHIFSVALAFADGMDVGRVDAAWLRARAPEELFEGRAVARYGALVRGRVGGWLDGASPRELARVIAAEAGHLQSGHDWLERTTWHAAQHVRQLEAAITALGLPVRDALPSADLTRLPLPSAVW
jgi:hypothetical protein